jgi:hypothetical protein
MIIQFSSFCCVETSRSKQEFSSPFVLVLHLFMPSQMTVSQPSISAADAIRLSTESSNARRIRELVGEASIAYLQQHGIPAAINNIVERILLDMPDDPLKALEERLRAAAREAQQQAAPVDAGPGSVPATPPPDKLSMDATQLAAMTLESNHGTPRCSDAPMQQENEAPAPASGAEEADVQPAHPNASGIDGPEEALSGAVDVMDTQPRSVGEAAVEASALAGDEESEGHQVNVSIPLPSAGSVGTKVGE